MFGTCGVLRGLYVYFYYVSVCYDTKICLSMVVSFLGGRTLSLYRQNCFDTTCKYMIQSFLACPYTLPYEDTGRVW